MEQIPCVNCGKFFIPRNRSQNYCSDLGCQRTRKATWQRYKLRTDTDYRTQQQLSQQKWLRDNPGYWKRYRQKNDDKTERNRILQTIRNRRNRQSEPATDSFHNSLIAKMDARKPYHFSLVGQFYLVPVIAKMDVSKVNIYDVSGTYC